MRAKRVAASTSMDLAKREVWLAFLDTYRTLFVAPPAEFERVLQAMRMRAA